MTPSPEHLASLAGRWGIETNSLEILSGNVNHIFRSGTRVLRIGLEEIWSVERWTEAAELSLHAQNCGVPVAQAQPSESGHLVELLNPWMASVVRFVPGREISIEELSAEPFIAWGQSLAKLHNAMDSFEPVHTYTWDHIWRNIQEWAEQHDKGFREEVRELSAWLDFLPRDDFGVCHADMRPGNVIWDGTTATVIDFDEPVVQWRSMDIARAMLEYSLRSDRDFVLRNFLDGYRSVRPFQVQDLSMLLRARCVCMIVWTLQEGGNPDRVWYELLAQHRLSLWVSAQQQG